MRRDAPELLRARQVARRLDLSRLAYGTRPRHVHDTSLRRDLLLWLEELGRRLEGGVYLASPLEPPDPRSVGICLFPQARSPETALEIAPRPPVSRSSSSRRRARST